MNNELLDTKKSVPLKEYVVQFGVFFIFSFICYGLFANKLGYFWDDWGAVYTQFGYGSNAFWKYVTERPIDNYYYSIVSHIFGIKPLIWHVYIIFTKWISVCLFYFFIRKLSDNKSIALSSALFFLVYPASAGISIAWIYSFVYVMISLVLLSLIFMREYIVNRKYKMLFLAASLLFELLHLLTSEYFIGIELCRIFIIYIILFELQTDKSRLLDFQLFKKAFRYLVPYLTILAGYIIWRAFFFRQNSLPETNTGMIWKTLKAAPLHSLSSRIANYISDVFSVTINLWTQCFSSDNFSIGAKIIIAISFALMYFLYIRGIKKKAMQDSAIQQDKSFSALLMFSGFLMILFGILPVFVIGRTIILSSHGIGDRYSLPEIIGSCILLSGFLHYYIKDPKYLYYTISILTAFACGFQFTAGQTFNKENIGIENFYRQLSWRAPQVETGTLFLMVPDPKINITSASYSYSFGINALYGPDPKMKHQHFWLSSMNSNRDPIPQSIQPELPVEINFRSYHFSGNTSQAITLYCPETGCLRVIDTINNEWTDADALTRSASYLTKTALIHDTLPNNNGFLNRIYGKENTSCWCYYFEKMELSIQNKNWDKAFNFLSEAKTKKLNPDNDIEWIIALQIGLHKNKTDFFEDIIKNKITTKLAKGLAYRFISENISMIPEGNKLINILKEYKNSNEADDAGK